MILGKVEWIRRYPVKSLRGELLAQAQVLSSGIDGDRVRQLVVESGHARVGKAYRGKENERLHLTERVDDALSLGRQRGVALSVESGEHFFDDAPISLLLDRWLETLSAHLGYTVEPERFRPNFFVRCKSAAAPLENQLVGTVLEIGDVRLRVILPTERCVAITYHPNRDDPDPRILRYVAQERNAIMGVYCDVLRAGTARTGDSVRFAER